MTHVELGGGRFVLERLAGSGGMGEVHLARDREGGQPVAIKRIRPGQTDDVQRFTREARLLATVAHPHVVRYVAHGVDAEGAPWLAMEWLDGEDLSTRLLRGPLGIQECIQLARCISSALANLHQQGIVHRDIKPSNLFISGGRFESVKLLDFGIARMGAGSATKLTGTNAILGTVGYMAPEQASGSARVVDARSDIFALGAVLYEALSGVAPFAGAHAVAILTKILFEDPIPLRDKRSGVPAHLEELIMRMLSKDPDHRPKDGAALVDAFNEMGDVPEDEAPRSGVLPADGFSYPTLHQAVTTGERRMIALLVITPFGDGEVVDDGRLREIADSFGGRFERLWDGSAAVLLKGEAVPTDLCAQAARCAIATRKYLVNTSIALAVERIDDTSKQLYGGAIEKAVHLLMREKQKREMSGVLLDDTAAGLLDARFHVLEAGEFSYLMGEHQTGENIRTLLGRPTSSVGRDRELRNLEESFAECIEERTAMAILITAGPGIGKSRLAYDFCHAIRQIPQSATIWTGRGDSLRVGSAFAFMYDLLKRAASLMDDESIEARRARLLKWVTSLVPTAHERAIGELLGEICGVTFPDDANHALREARLRPETMGERVRAAFIHVLGAALAKQPVVILFEDLHWGDLPSVQLLDRALRELSDRPLFIVALARPSVHETFPKLWSNRRLTEIRLRELSRRAGEQLVRQVLGDRANADIVERIVQLAGGNAFYLEELIRAAAERRLEAFPETVVAMVQSRLAGLDSFSRHVLRAASIYGETFWTGAVATLVGDPDQRLRLGDVLGELVTQEFITKKNTTRFSGEDEYSFRHALLRAGAYAMLLDKDKSLGHRLAAEWLEASGEQDPIALGEHFELGGVAQRAAESWQRATVRAAWAIDSAAAIKYATRGLALTTESSTRVALLELLCEIYLFLNQWDEAAAIAAQMLTIAKSGSSAWARGILVQLMSAQAGVVLSAEASPVATLALLSSAKPEPAGMPSMAISYMLLLFTMVCLGRLDLAERCVRCVAEMTTPQPDEPEFVRGARQSVQPFVHSARGFYDWTTGMYEDAERVLRLALLAGELLGPGLFYVYSYLGEVLADRYRFAEAKEVAALMVAQAKAAGQLSNEGRGRWVLAHALCGTGDLANAEIEARNAVDQLKNASTDIAAVQATLANILRMQGHYGEALAMAENAMQSQAAAGQFAYRRVCVQLSYVECLHAVGREEEARMKIQTIIEWIHTAADTIDDVTRRRAFIEDVRENRRAFELARQWASSTES